MHRREDTLYMGELRAAVKRRPRIAANLLLIAIISFIVSFLVWSHSASLDEVTVGMGQVIPSLQVQVVQNLEGGIVSEILVQEGSYVKKGEPLIIIDDTQFRSKHGEERIKQLILLSMLTRLKAEVQGGVPIFSKDLKTEKLDLIENEMALFVARQNELNQGIAVLFQQLEQKKQEIVELNSRIEQLKKSYMLGKKEIEIIEPSVKRGATSEVELIRLQREVNGIESSLVEAEMAIPRIKSVIAEIEQRIKEKKATFQTKVLSELNDAEANLQTLQKSMVASADRLMRTTVVSPVKGTIKQVMINTVGGVISPGMDIVEIVPQDDTLLIEARVNPSDVAFLYSGQSAKVKITAYDYSIYGSLDAQLEHISADTIVDPQGMSFYKIRVRTDKNYLITNEDKLPIIPGMVAEVDVLTGEKTVLEYLMKPIMRAKSKALRER